MDTRECDGQDWINQGLVTVYKHHRLESCTIITKPYGGYCFHFRNYYRIDNALHVVEYKLIVLKESMNKHSNIYYPPRRAHNKFFFHFTYFKEK